MEQHAHVPEALKPKDVHEHIGTRRSATDSPYRIYVDRNNPNDPLRRAGQPSGGSDRSVEHSPLHRNQAKASWERKGSSEGGHSAAPGTPGRFKPKGGGRGDESDRSVEHSPLHRYQAKASGEGKGSSEGGHSAAPGTPGRFKPKGGGRGDESPEVVAVPKFGGWDESNPSSADGFSDIFKKVSEEKRTGSAKVPHITDDSIYINSYSQGGSNSKSSSCCCFSWGKK